MKHCWSVLLACMLLLAACMPEASGTVIYETAQPTPIPSPTATPAASATPSGPRALFGGTELGLVAGGLRAPVGITVDPQGTLYVLQNSGELLKFPKYGSVVVARGFYMPAGIVWFHGSVVILSRGRLDALQDWNSDGEPERIVPWADELPSNLAPAAGLASDGIRFLFFATGTDCATCVDTYPLRGTILVLDLQTGRIPRFATGVGEVRGLAWLPGSTPTTLVAALGGDDGSPGRLSKIATGDNLGWPDCLVPHPEACADSPNLLLALESPRVPTGVQALKREGGGWWLVFASYVPRLARSGKISAVALNPTESLEGEPLEIVDGLEQPVGLLVTQGGDLLVADMGLGQVLRLAGLPLR